MSAKGMMPRANDTIKFPTKDLVAICKPKNSVIIAGMKPNNVNL
jgi:hypothetical protein